jgi:RNA recognition motif-containing protein
VSQEKKLYVGNVSYNLDDEKLKELFEEFGTVVSAQIIMDRRTNRSKGFGFVEMSSPKESAAAIKEMHGKEIDGRSITVNEAKPREERSDRR